MAENIMMPTLGLTMTEGTVDQWYKGIGDKIEKGEAVCSISSEKLTSDVEAPVAGVLLKIVTAEGGEAPCQAPIGIIGAEGEVVEKEEVSATPNVETEAQEEQVNDMPIKEQVSLAQPRIQGERIFITPIARKIANDKGYDISQIPGTGGNGRITRRDVESFVPQPALVAGTGSIGQDGEGLVGMRKIIAKRMANSLQQAAQLTIQKKADVTDLMIFRKELRAKMGDSMPKGAVGINTLLIKAVTLALGDYPEMNAWYGEGVHEQLAEIHMGMAVSVDEGLVVPVIKNVQGKALSELASSMQQVVEDAQDGTLEADLYSGSTFTITNLGQSGIEYFTPILNSPEVGILGIGALGSRLAFDEERNVVERQELPLSLTFDHQVVDGAPAGEFLNRVCFYLENPYLLVV